MMSRNPHRKIGFGVKTNRKTNPDYRRVRFPFQGVDMILSTGRDPGRLGMKILIAHNECANDCAAGRLVRKLKGELEENGVAVLSAQTAFDAEMLLASDPMIQALLLAWDLDDELSHRPARRVAEALRARNADMPLFLFTDRENAAQIPLEMLRISSDFVWLFEDSASFIAGRVLAALHHYREHLLPPMFEALTRFSRTHEYSWHTPGHTGGTAFMKDPAGRAFFDFFGENLFRSDLSISVGELGSLLDHSGPIGEGERYTAKVFGAHRSYHVTNGSSTSNRVIMMASVTRGQVALCDRNAHKSIEHAITMSGAVPTYMLTTRNHYGIIGPIPPANMTPEAIARAVAENPLVTGDVEPKPVHAIVTNSTYDGLCYNVERVEELLGQSVDRLHFDEAWYGYARFNPLYEKRFAMYGDPTAHGSDRPTVFATQSTHKLLAALSQASMIHVRDGRNPISHSRFNEAFMMHASTSPNYAILASNDVSAAMMDGPGGKTLTDESIHEAVAFRRLVSRIHAEEADKGEWFVNVWQPDTVTDEKGKEIPFWQAEESYLASCSSCWTLRPGDSWHGFKGLEDRYCMLDPIKVSITTPGMCSNGEMEAWGIPASVLTAYLNEDGIVAEKTADFSILFLFSLGVTKGKWGTLINTLLRFKSDYDANAPLKLTLPSLVEKWGGRYAGMGLRDLSSEMFGKMKELRMTALQAQAFSQLPQADMTPSHAYELLVRGRIEQVDLEGCAGRTLATGIVPYPPGIPLIMPGENAGELDGPALGYLKALEAYDRSFPGFGHDNHGVEVEKGTYLVSVIR